MNYFLIGRRIREFRLRKNMTQAQLAEQSMLSVAYIGFIENARKHPSLDALVKIAAVLDTTVISILTGQQKADSVQRADDFEGLLFDCSADEKYILYMILESIKKVLRNGIPMPNVDWSQK